MRNPLNDFNSYKINSISRYFRSHDFLRSLAMTFLMLTTSCLLYITGHHHYILGNCIGILLTSFNDMPGKATNRSLAMVLSTLLSALIIIVINLLQFSLVFMLIFIACTTFALYMLSAFGNRAEIFAFVGALAISLGFVGDHQGKELLVYALTIFCGGIFYAIASWIYHLLTKNRQINEQLGELAKLTAGYLKQGIIAAKRSDAKEEVNQNLLGLQINIIEKQGNLGVLILSNRTITKPSSKRNRQMFLLKQLIDFMELAVATPLNLAKIKALPTTNEATLAPFINVAEQIYHQLFLITKELRSANVSHISKIQIDFDEVEETIQRFFKTVDLPQAREGVLVMHHLLDHYKLQIRHLMGIIAYINTPESIKELALSENQQGLFYQKESYHLRRLMPHVNINSPVFRQAVRMAFGFVLAYLLGALLDIEKAYWIMLTTLLILRLSYGITMQRALKRVVGTAIGAALALLLLQISTSIVFFVALAALGMLFSFSLLVRNYTLASLAITLCIIFSFALLDTHLHTIIAFRLIDTIIGALISIGVAYFVLPFWECQSFERNITNAAKANQSFLQEILFSHFSDKPSDTSYRLKRKSAYIASSVLNANLQRYTQDPKSKRGKYDLFYDLVALNHSIVSSITNLGNYLKGKQLTTLRPVLQEICSHLDHDFDAILETKNNLPGKEKAYSRLALYWQQLEDAHNAQYKLGNTAIDEVLKPAFKEAHIIKQEMQRIKELLQTMKTQAKGAF
ncbi:FUSC family protein [uncultured Microscilla sp.]|uniref:FUSC family protein n=1 Tax=uncultured Microscilla sp. TaxID=432653 RepID=UPI0026194E22|nr:FUSC family protein [uncultured Microscilla sp.]